MIPQLVVVAVTPLLVRRGRYGHTRRHPVQPEEWSLVPLFVIDEAVSRIKDGTITGCRYDPGSAALKLRMG